MSHLSLVRSLSGLVKSRVPARVVAARSGGLKECTRRFACAVRYMPSVTTSSYWPSGYGRLYRPATDHWPELSPLEVLDAHGARHSISHVKGPVSQPLLSYTMFELLENAVKLHGDKLALSAPFQGVKWTYKELLDQVESLALGLVLRLGLSKGDRVGVWLPNTSEWLLLQFACARIGAILVCVNPAYRAHELQHAIDLVGAKALFFQASIKSSNYVDLLKSICPTLDTQKKGEVLMPQMTSLRYLVHIREQSELIPPTFPSMSFEEILVKPTKETREAFKDILPITNTEPTNVQFTSGTTGLPKGTTLTHRNIVNNGYFVGERLGMNPGDTLVTPVPMYHCFGCVMSNIAAISHGVQLVYPAPQFNAQATLKAVHDHKASILYGVPTMFITERALPNFAEYDLSSLRTGILAGSTCPEVTMNMVRDDMHMKDVTICYGMTETSPVSLQTARNDPVWARVETVGRVQDHLEVKLIDPSGNTVPLGQSGEICTKGYSVMQGYWGNDQATKSSIVDGWMHTGDLGTMDTEGYVRIIGRNKDMISRGGEKVYPREVEEFLYQHPSIQDVQIVGVPDERLGEQLFAWVKLRTGKPALTADDIALFCKNEIAHYKIPKYVQCLAQGEEFPMTVSGKIQKFILKDKAVKLLGLEPHLKKL